MKSTSGPRSFDLGARTLGGLILGLAGIMAGLPAVANAAGDSSVSVTVYNQNFGVVKDVRMLDLDKGVQTIRIDDVAASIDATSVHFSAVDHPGDVAVLEQNYQYDLAGADRVLERYLNRSVTAVLEDGTVREGMLYSFDSGNLVLGVGGGVLIINREQVRDLSLGDLPGGLVVKPTLVWTLSSSRAGRERGEISYLTDNISWHAEYVAVVNAKDTALDLAGWVSVDNRSGATYRDAKLKLVAGDVNRVQDRVQARFEVAMAMKADAAEPQFQERAFFEYHIYTLERPATIADRETKQLSLFPSASANVEKRFVFDGARRGNDVAVEVEFENRKDNGLGMALPAGKVRVYKEDADGSLEFVGEDRVDHIPRNEKVNLYLGNAFDVKGERKRTEFRRISDRSSEETWEIEIRNRKTEKVKVVVVERLAGDWIISNPSHPFEKKDSNTVEFVVDALPDTPVTVRYTVRRSW